MHKCRCLGGPKEGAPEAHGAKDAPATPSSLSSGEGQSEAGAAQRLFTLDKVNSK